MASDEFELKFDVVLSRFLASNFQIFKSSCGETRLIVASRPQGHDATDLRLGCYCMIISVAAGVGEMRISSVLEESLMLFVLL